MKYPLMLLVVFIHLNTSSAHCMDTASLTASAGKALYYVLNILLSRNFAPLANGVFFFISGYLYFANVKELDWSSYKRKTVSRIKTLLVPYLFWNILCIGLYWIFGLIEGSSVSIDLSCIWVMNVAEGGFYTPIDGPLWFIRDLFVQSLLLPLVIAFIVKKRHLLYLFLAVVLSLYCFDKCTVCFHPLAYTFFSFGCIWGAQKISFVNIMKGYSWVIVPISIIVYVARVYFSINNTFIAQNTIMKLWPFCGICIITLCSYYFVRKGRHILSTLNESSFFLYAIHVPFIIQPLYWYCYKFLKLEESIWGVNWVYIMTFFISVFVSVLLSRTLRRLVPRYIPLLTGGR